MRPALVLMLAVGLAVAAPVPKAVRKADDSALLEGRWESVSIDTGSGTRADTTWWLDITDGKLSTGCGQSNGYAACAFKLDQTASPKQLDIEVANGQFILTVYQLDGDTLTWCESSSTTNRATELQTAGGFNLFVFKRVKKE